MIGQRGSHLFFRNVGWTSLSPRFNCLLVQSNTTCHQEKSHVRRFVDLIPAAIVIALFAISIGAVTPIGIGTTHAADSTDESVAAYADAANFQTNGAFDLAIDGWKTFLKKFPNDELASKAAHYLGVCYMQQESPDYVAAAQAFEKALEDKKFELREESLANQGWCWYAAAGDGQQRDPKYLKATITAYLQLQREKPKSQFLDRALFYSGEAAYGLGDRPQAIKFYDKLLALPSTEESPLRCDALYARGIAHEELDQYDNALASFQQLLSSCDKKELLTDVHLRMGDVRIFRKDFDKAVDSFEAAIQSAENDADKSYAIFRQAFALVQAKRPGEAAKKYDLLQKQFPDSKYAGSALLAAAQSLYRSGDLEAAAERFQRVLSQNNVETATEAAHWLARIYITKKQPDRAVAVAKQQIAKGTEGKYAVDLKLDLAEAMSLNPDSVAESVKIAEAVYRESPNDLLAPRALYNAAFSALQTNQAAKALDLAKEFLKKFPKDTLVPDVQFIAAEGNLLTGKLADASTSYEQLLKQTAPRDNVQRPLWVLRAATTTNAAGKYDQTIGLLKREYGTLTDPRQKAEAQMLIGQAYMMGKKYSDAALAYQRSQEIDPKWARAEEAQLLSGTALFAAGKRDAAKSTWQKLVSRGGKSRMADQARYKLAQLASNSGDHDTAVKLYSE
ncbi:MAG: tetratricopeptide repeat protein, partial [Pirellulaceae bacterium]|nr:tetratricopeptide repeat protein [Pirellulaceae bacterium]